MTIDTDEVRVLVGNGVSRRVYPGAVWAVGDSSGVLAEGATGLLDPERPDGLMQLDTIFDVASLTKILAVWSTIGCLWTDGRLDLDQPLGSSWPEVRGHPLGEVTARHLLTHTAGVPLRAQLRNLYGTDPDRIRRGVLHEAAYRPPGEAVEYTDRAALVLGYLAEHLSGRSLDQLAVERVWTPLDMTTTRFGPMPAALAHRCAPTELDDESGHHIKGTVHDFSARLLGVCGIAGVFTELGDLAVFLRYLLDPAQGSAWPGFGPEWITESLQIHTGALQPARGLFWHPAPDTEAGDDVWVHYGFTGTGMWISPKQQRWGVLLTNKVYYTRERAPLAEIRNRFRTLAFSSLSEAGSVGDTGVPGAPWW